MPENLITQLKAKKIAVLYDQAIVALSGALLIAIILGFIFWPKIPSQSLLMWLALFVLLTAVRGYGVYQYKQSNIPPEKSIRWLHGYNLGALLSGALWGSFSLFLIQSADVYYSGIVVVCVAGLTAAATATYSVSLLTYFVFSTPTLIPATIYLLLQTDVFLVTLGYFLILFYSYMQVTMWRLSILMNKSLSYEFGNKKLLMELEEEKYRVSSLNKELKTDLEGRMRTLAKLMHEKKNAEQLAEKLKTLSSKDGLTGIDNRRRFDEMIINEWYRCIRSKMPLSLIMCDIDYFKPYNDMYGHQEGDTCLCRIAHLLEDHARRGGDRATRYGGEEFALILPDTDVDDAMEIAEQIRISIEELRLPHNASHIKDIVTASFGVTTIVPKQDQTPNILVKQADKALYKAKSMGRNKVVRFETESNIISLKGT